MPRRHIPAMIESGGEFDIGFYIPNIPLSRILLSIYDFFAQFRGSPSLETPFVEIQRTKTEQ